MRCGGGVGMIRGERGGATVTAQVRISRGKGALLWGRRCSGGSGQGRSGRDVGALPWGVDVVEAVGRGATAVEEVRWWSGTCRQIQGRRFGYV